MQQLQKPVLNKLQPGIQPIFIISPQRHDGDTLSMLLSNHLFFRNPNEITGEKKDREKNYFSSDSEQKLFHVYDKITTKKEKNKETNASKIEDFKSSLKFIVDQGLDTQNLWGVLLDYSTFFDLKLFELFPNAFFIFLYGTRFKKIELKGAESLYLSKVINFYNNNSHNSILLHVNNVIYTPAIVLENLPFDYEVELKNISDINTVVPDQHESDLYIFSNSQADFLLKKELEKHNLVSESHGWFNGSEVLNILITNDATPDTIIQKIRALYSSFTSNLTIGIISNSNTRQYLVQKLLKNTRFDVSGISFYINQSNLSDCLNKIISEHDCSYIVVDNLELSYSIYNILSPHKKFNPAPAFITAGLNRKPGEDTFSELSLADLLSLKAIPDNITFSKDTWQKINGFDTDFEKNTAIWDFLIRSVAATDNFGLETDATVSLSVNKTEATAGKLIDFEGYKTMIGHHSQLYKGKVNAIIKAIADNQVFTQDEIKTLNNKIQSLDSLLNHSKSELRSINEHKVVLQNQINLMESRWYFRLARKINHLKNIFVKEQSTKKNVLINFLKFIVFSFTRPGRKIIRRIFKGGFKKLYLLAEERPVKIVYLDEGQDRNGNAINNYHEWIVNKLNPSALKNEYNGTISTLKLQPKISVIMPVYNPPVKYLKDAIESVINQLYENWELCIADDCSTNPQVKRLLTAFSAKDKRIKVVFRTENGHISAASNSALGVATGDYILLLDHDDLLTPNCMFEVVKHINDHPDDDFIYSDEDKTDDSKLYHTPFFKPDWSPDRLLAINYLGHVAVIRKSLVDSINGFRLGFEGSQDYDLYLRTTEMTTNIGHIPKVLYHWRIHESSVAGDDTDAKTYAYIASKKAIDEALVRRNIAGEAKYLPIRGCYRIKYQVTSYDKVSIIIPTKDQAQLMKTTIDTIISLTSYPNYEIIVLNNNSTTKEFFDLMKEYSDQYGDIFRCVDASFPFNFSKLINLGVSICEGTYVLMLNNDVEIIQRDWITNMVSYAQQQRIGAIGVKLLYPDDNIQHAGTIVGLGGVAGHIMTGVYKEDRGYFHSLQLVTNYSAVTAACLMVRKSVFEEVSGMDEFLEVEYNDVDFCLKIMDAGYYNIYLPEVVLYHYESATRGHPHQNSVSYQRHVREIGYFKNKWAKYLPNDPFYNPNLSYDFADMRMNLNA
jgi:O-antigen biosynthesis protein